MSGNRIKPSVVQSGADIKFYKVDLSVEGNGEVTSEPEYRFCVKKILILLQNLLKIVARVKITKRMRVMKKLASEVVMS